ncbi:MAG: NAD(P)H-dependent glycerol-3-phosphate dehydrogenase [Lachnospiraceae bacterium]|nr:NAD(P)H-dependent glycerol-3-phosphate dehydrogenase [Lachnospiraceae bacterium]
MKKIAIIGSGSWGTALAVMFDKYGHDVTMWSWKEEEASEIRKNKENKEFLPGVEIKDSLKITTSPEECVLDADIVITAIPSKFVRVNMEKFIPYVKPNQVILNVAKGMEESSLMRLSEVLCECFPNNKVCVLSGPSHAEEVGRDIPTACVIASSDIELAKELQVELMNQNFRIYTNTDVIGVELGAALKNVIALAAGMSDGLGYGDNTKAALMTRGMVEIGRLGKAMGGKQETFMGLSGMGDLIVTCTSMHSRNRRAGILLGQGKTLEEALKEVHMVVEGVNTAKSINALADKYNVRMPIAREIKSVLFEGKDPRQAVLDLMMRDKKEEALD